MSCSRRRTRSSSRCCACRAALGAADTAAYLRHPPATEPRSYWLAEQAGRCSGFARLGAAPGAAVGTAEVRVRPDARRAGDGSALLAAVRERALELGRDVLVGAH